ncbi:MAG: metallophosphoesterase [Pseudomonadaceae bacterium]|nr:metallophosphoesterase [Pseudomonadaceae bacterium]
MHIARLIAKAMLAASLLLPSIVAADTSAVVPQAADREFHFVVLGDSQFHDPIGFNRVVSDAARLNPAFVVQVGDMIRGYNVSLAVVRKEWARFRRQLAPLDGIPFVAVPGNHDVYSALKRPDKGVTRLFVEQWGEIPRSFDYQGIRFVVLNSDSVGAPNQIGEEQRDWLDTTLAEDGADMAFVFLHRPPDALKDARQFHELMRKHAVNTVFYGHHHHGHLQVRDGVRYVMTNAAADSATAPAQVGSEDHLLFVSIRDDLASLAAIRADSMMRLERIDPIDNYDLFELTRYLAPKQVELKEVDERESRYRVRIPLSNRSKRVIDVYSDCSSADARWRFEPARLPKLTLAPGASGVVELEVVEALPSEALPECRLTVPYQTSLGEWLSHEVLVPTIR